MKRLSLILLLFAGSFTVNAQSKDETLVIKAVEKLKAAMISGSKADLENLSTNDISYAHSSGLIQNKKEFVADFATKKSVFVTIELSNQTVNMSGDVAVVYHRLKATTFDSGVPGNPHLDIVYVWKKIKGDWKLFYRRACKVPVVVKN